MSFFENGKIIVGNLFVVLFRKKNLKKNQNIIKTFAETTFAQTSFESKLLQ
jgi:hypothetical protein